MPEIRINSTSGGVASAIIESFIKIGGYVSACHFKNGNFVFEITNNLEIAKTFSGSKYVKSNPIGIYDQIKDRLKTHKVLFIGLPCQVAAVKNYFEDEDNLYTIDLICHGTPSAKLLEGYLLEKGYQLSKFKNISFRGESGVKRIDKSKKNNSIQNIRLLSLCFFRVDQFNRELLFLPICLSRKNFRYYFR